MVKKVSKIILVLVLILTIFNNYNVHAITDPLKSPNAYDSVKTSRRR